MKVPMMQEEGHFQLFIFECRDKKNGNYMGTSQEDPKTVYPTGLLAKTVTICFEASQVHIFGTTTIAQRGVATICVL